jgi:hypothetical protein
VYFLSCSATFPYLLAFFTLLISPCSFALLICTDTLRKQKKRCVKTRMAHGRELWFSRELRRGRGQKVAIRPLVSIKPRRPMADHNELCQQRSIDHYQSNSAGGRAGVFGINLGTPQD